MQHSRDRHSPGGGDKRLGQNFAAEDSLQLSVWLPCPKQSDLNLLQVQQVDELDKGLRHDRSLVVSARHVLFQVSRCQPADDDSRIQLVGADYVGHQPITFEGGHASSRLVATGLYQ